MLTAGYRGDGLRAWKQSGADRTYFLYSGTLLVCEMNTSGAATAVNTVGAAGLISRHTSSGSVFYTFDAHGSVCQRLDGGGNVLSTQTFDAYGYRQSTDGNADPYAGFGGQSGYYTDWETGTAASALELLGLRYYDPQAGRFLTRDPASYKGGANLYEYCSNGPTGASDPSGMFNWPAGAACLGAVLGNLFGGVISPGGYTDYNTCLAQRDCYADVYSSVLATVVFAVMDGLTGGAITLTARYVVGCLEGLISAILHNAAEAICRDEYHPCVPEADSTCKFLANMMDVLFGCIDGFLGGILKGDEKKEVWEAIYEGLSALTSNGYESSNCAF